MVIGLALVAVALGSGSLAYLGFLGLLGKLRPNRWAGIRTAFTRASEQNWYDTHRAAGPILMYGGVLGFAVALAFAPFALAGKVGLIVGVVALAACATVMLFTLLLGFFAGASFAAARSTSPRSDQ